MSVQVEAECADPGLNLPSLQKRKVEAMTTPSRILHFVSGRNGKILFYFQSFSRHRSKPSIRLKTHSQVVSSMSGFG
jgi:hypothetical protein